MTRKLVKTELEKLKIGVKASIEALKLIKLPCKPKELEHFGRKLNPLLRFSSLGGEFDENEYEDVSAKSVFLEILKYVCLHLAEQVTNFLKKSINSYPNVFDAKNGTKLVYGNFPSLINKPEDMPYAAGFHCCLLLSAVINLTDKREDNQRACCKDGLISFIFKEMFPQLSNASWEEGSLIEELLNRCMDVVYNCCKLPEHNKCYKDSNAVDVLVKIRADTNHLDENELNLTALLTLGYLIDDSNNDKIIFGQGTVGTLIKYLKRSLERTDHNECGFHAEELAYGLQHISIPDENKILICNEGGVDVLAELLQKAINDDERISSCNALWSLCFSDKGKDLINSNEDLRLALSKLKKSSNPKVKEAAGGVIWQLKREPESKEKQSVIQDGKGGTQFSTGHVMLSYQWDNQDMVKEIAKLLEQKGYKVWIDVNKIAGNIMDAMADAVEEAEIIIVCISRKYKNSANTRAEADYAFQLKKSVIPLMMEKDYIPDGWLGLLLGSKLRLDFTSSHTIPSSIEQLCKQLGNRCVIGAEPRIVPTSAIEVNEPNLLGQEPYFGHHPLQSFDSVDNGSKNCNGMNGRKMDEISKWENNQVVEWLKYYGMKGCMEKSRLKKITGIHLVMLYKLRKECPKLYYNIAPWRIGVADFLDFLALTNQIEKLMD